MNGPPHPSFAAAGRSSHQREFKCSELGQDRGSSPGLVKSEAFSVRSFAF